MISFLLRQKIGRDISLIYCFSCVLGVDLVSVRRKEGFDHGEMESMKLKAECELCDRHMRCDVSDVGAGNRD